MNLSIIIVNYNVKEFLQNLIHSIHKAAQNLSYEIIIVDNASDDGSVDFIKEKFPDVKLFANQKNLGFSKANNIGLAESKGEYILLLNPDTIVSEDTFEKMISFFNETKDAGLAGCKILNSDGSLQLACRRSFPGPWTSFCKVSGLSNLFPKSKLFARYNLTYLDENKTYEVDAISGSFMMFPRKIYEEIGGLDEQFFMYGEDLDFCYRIQKYGQKVYYFHDTQIIHYKGESTKRSSLDETKIFYSAMHLFVKKHLSSSFLVEFILRIAIGLREFIAFMASRKLILLAIILDFLLFDLSIYVAENFYKHSTTWLGFNKNHLLFIFIFPAFLNVFISSIIRVYRRDSLSILRTFGALIISFFLISSGTFFFKQFAYSRAVVIITFILAFIILAFWRIIMKLFFKVGMDKYATVNKRALIVGVNKPAIQIAAKLKSKASDFHNVVGLIGFSHKEVGTKIDDFEIVGSLESIKKIISEKKINEVIFSSEELTYNEMMKIVSTCQDENVEFKLIGSNLDFLVGKSSVSMLEDIPLFEINYNISNPVLRFIKITFDYSVALLVLFFIYPFIYLFVKLSNKNSDFKKMILQTPKIILGKASFVGPKHSSKNGNLFLGKQGLTGLWYLENSNETEIEKLDIYYAKNQNIWLDLEILGKTLNKMWSARS